MKRYAFAMLLMVSFGLGYLVYNAHNFSYRTKITLTISTPEGSVEVSGVRQIYASRSYINFAQTGGNYWARKGEALVVELRPEVYLFAPPKGWPNLAREMSAQGIISGRMELDHPSAIRAQTEPISVPIERMRWMVTFADVSEPTSITGVDPENLAATFGAGYALISVKMQATDDALDGGRVEQILSWLRGYNDWLSFTDADGKTQEFGASDFVYEIYK